MDTFDEFESEIDTETINFDPPEKPKLPFAEFLENNLGDLIICPITTCVMCDPVIASDGFSYELSQLLQMKKYSHRSPKTRETLSDIHIPVQHTKDLIFYADKYDLQVGKEKFIITNSFEDNLNEICDTLKNGNYDFIRKFKEFKLSHIDTNGRSFCQIVFESVQHNNEKGFEVLKYIFERSPDFEFNLVNGQNVLHLLCRYACNVLFIDYIFKYLKSQISKFNVPDIGNHLPIQYSWARKSEVIECVLSHIGTNSLVVPIPYIVNMMGNQVNSTIIKRMIDSTPDINDMSQGTSLLFKAIESHRTDLIKYLLGKGANAKQKNGSNENAIHHVCKFGDAECVFAIIDTVTTTDLEEECIDGWRPIHIASYYSKRDVIEALLDRIVAVNVPITKFNGKECSYLPINLIESNTHLKDQDRDALIELVVQYMSFQTD